VVVSVADTGRGMDPDVLARLFEPNFSTKAGPKGRGYGLATIYGIVSSVGGGLSVASESGKGSMFRLWLPQAGVPQAQEEGSSAAPSIPREEILGEDTVADEPSRVLVVEDEPSLRDMLRAVLERYGFEVEEAVNGDDADEVIASLDRWPDLIVTDVLLRDGLGTEMAARFRAKRPSLRVLFISGHSLETLADQGIRIDPGEFLEKPFTPSQLGNKAKAALAKDGKAA
jgi:CheY-like chemotaxis protein